MDILGLPLGYIMYWINEVVNNYGLSLVLFVILTKVVFFPMGVKQQRSSAKMMKMSGKQKELQAKYGKDKTRLNEEMMKLYEKEGYNPMSGCLPMIIQMVLLFGIVDVIYKPLRHMLHIPKDVIKLAEDALTAFLGKPVSTPEIQIISHIQGEGADLFAKIFDPEMLEKIQTFNMNFIGINLGETPTWTSILVLIPILSGVTALISTLISMKIQAKNGQQTQGAMKYTLMAMPLMSVWIGFSMPAGAGIYWTISNVMMVAQQVVIQAIWPMEKVANEAVKVTEKQKEKMRKKRERMEQYRQMQEQQRGGTPTPRKAIETTEDKELPKIDRDELNREREATSRKIAEARRRMAEKYGEDYQEENDKT